MTAEACAHPTTERRVETFRTAVPRDHPGYSESRREICGLCGIKFPFEDVCPRCSDGLPICIDRKPDGSLYTHEETCGTYEWADDVCGPCANEMGWDDVQPV